MGGGGGGGGGGGVCREMVSIDAGKEWGRDTEKGLGCSNANLVESLGGGLDLKMLYSWVRAGCRREGVQGKGPSGIPLFVFQPPLSEFV